MSRRGVSLNNLLKFASFLDDLVIFHHFTMAQSIFCMSPFMEICLSILPSMVIFKCLNPTLFTLLTLSIKRMQKEGVKQHSIRLQIFQKKAELSPGPYVLTTRRMKWIVQQFRSVSKQKIEKFCPSFKETLSFR